MSDSDQQFAADVKRTVVLGTYIALWGMPAIRRVAAGPHGQIEVYLFPACEDTGNVHRLATVSQAPEGQDEREFLFAWLPTEDEPHGEPSQEVLETFEDLVFDAAVHCQERGGAEPGMLLVASRRPAAMAPDHLLLDEPVIEDESLAQLHLGRRPVPVYWLVPLFEDEASLVSAEGAEALDAIREASSQNLFRMDRASMLG